MTETRSIARLVVLGRAALTILCSALALPGCILGFTPPVDGGPGDAGTEPRDAAADAPLDALVDASFDAGSQLPDAGPTCSDAGTPDASVASCGGAPCPEPRVCWEGNECLPGVNPVFGAYTWSRRQLTVGRHHSCYLGVTGRIGCWGDGSSGQLGGEPLSRTTSGGEHQRLLMVVPDLDGVAHVAAGDDFTCVVVLDEIVCWGGAARAWGADACAERATLSLPEGERVAYRPSDERARAEPAPYTALDAGDGFACVLSERGTVWCWGAADRGQMGTDPARDGAERPLPVAVALPGAARAVGLTTGVAHACAWTADGAAFCWGANDTGQLGRGDRAMHVGADAVSVLAGTDGVIAMAAGRGHTCALVGMGREVRCWGANEHMQLGVGPPSTVELDDVLVGAASGANQIHAAYDSTCVSMSSEGNPTCWGDNEHGQADRDPVTTAVSAAESVLLTTTYQNAIFVPGAHHMCRLVYDRVQRVHCSGSNELLQLGAIPAEGVYTAL